MKQHLTILGAWVVLFPINFVLTTLAIGLQYFMAIFHMPVDLWYELNEELKQIHIEDE